MSWKGWESFVPPTEARDYLTPQAKPAKFLNTKTLANDGTPCDSKTEAARWDMLCLMQKAGEISDLLPHPSFALFTNGTRTGRITFDALYVEAGRLICEDTKSPRTRWHAAYRQRLRTFQACYPHIKVMEWLA